MSFAGISEIMPRRPGAAAKVPTKEEDEQQAQEAADREARIIAHIARRRLLFFREQAEAELAAFCEGEAFTPAKWTEQHEKIVRDLAGPAVKESQAVEALSRRFTDRMRKIKP